MAGLFMNPDQYLYFFALVPPEDIQASITRIKEEFKERYNASHALKSPPHITLIPPFEYEKSSEETLINSLDEFSIRETCFQQRLEGFGSFPPRVLFIKVHKNEALKELYFRFRRYMDNALDISSLLRGPSKFSPHMTVAFRDLTRENFYLAKPEYEKKSITFEFETDGIS